MNLDKMISINIPKTNIFFILNSGAIPYDKSSKPINVFMVNY